jgi:hypothetical protein
VDLADHALERCDGASVGEACPRSAPSSRATIALGEDFLYEFKAGPAGGLRPPSGPATTQRSPGCRPHPSLRARTTGNRAIRDIQDVCCTLEYRISPPCRFSRQPMLPEERRPGLGATVRPGRGRRGRGPPTRASIGVDDVTSPASTRSSLPEAWPGICCPAPSGRMRRARAGMLALLCPRLHLNPAREI